MLESRRPTLDAWLRDLRDLVGPLPYRAYETLPDELVPLQAALLLLADQPQGGVALFRLSDDELDASSACLARINAAAETLAPSLVRALEVVELKGGPRAVVVLSPTPSLTRWTGPPDLRPVPGTGLDDLEGLLVEHAPADVSAEELAAIPELWEEPERALIALGALYPWRGGLVATVSGLLTYGAYDRQILPGQRIIERAHGADLPRLGDIGEMIEAPVESLHHRGGLPKRIAAAILVNALALRRWDGRDEPVIVEVAEGRATILCPDTRLADWRAREGQRPNPNLDALLRRLEIWKGPMLDLRTIQQELRRAGLRPLIVEEEADKVALTLRASPEEIARIHAAERLNRPGDRDDAQVIAPPTPPAKAAPLLTVSASGPDQGVAATAPVAREVPRLMPRGAPPPTLLARMPPQRAPLSARAMTPPPHAAGRPTEPGSRLARGSCGRPSSALRLSPEARASQILTLLYASRDPLTREQIVRALAWSRSTTRAVLAALVEEGRVLQVADSPRSPHQRYRAA